MAGVASVGNTFTTTAGSKSVTVATPITGDLYVLVTAHTGTTSVVAPTDSAGGVYREVARCVRTSGADLMQAWVRTTKISSSSSLTITHNPGTTTGGGIQAIRVTGMARVGLSAIRAAGWVSAGAAGSDPTVTMNQAPVTGDPVIIALNTAASSNTQTRTGYSVFANLSYTTPTAGLRVLGIASGETTQALTITGSVAAFCMLAIELDVSVVNAAISTFTEDFSAALGGSWDTTTPSGTSQSVSAGQLQQTPLSTNTNSVVAQTTSSYSLEGSEVYARVDAMELTNSTSLLSVLFRLSPVTSSGAHIAVDGGGFIGALIGDDVLDNAGGLWSVAYSPSTHAWWRIRESGGQILFDTATSSASDPPVSGDWTTRATVEAYRLPGIGNLKIKLMSGPRPAISSAASVTTPTRWDAVSTGVGSTGGTVYTSSTSEDAMPDATTDFSMLITGATSEGVVATEAGSQTTAAVAATSESLTTGATQTVAMVALTAGTATVAATDPSAATSVQAVATTESFAPSETTSSVTATTGAGSDAATPSDVTSAATVVTRSASDPMTPGEVPSSTISSDRAVTETTTTAADADTAAPVTASASDPATPGDASSADRSTDRSAVETIVAAADGDTVAPLTASSSDLATPGETSSATLSTASTVTDDVSPSDSSSASAVTVTSHESTVTTSDVPSAQIAWTSAVIGQASADDIASVIAVTSADLTAPVLPGDSHIATYVTSSDRTEELVASDEPSVDSSIVTSASESAGPSDDGSAVLTAVAASAEAMDPSDDSRATWVATTDVIETAEPSDRSDPLLSAVVMVAEEILLSDEAMAELRIVTSALEGVIEADLASATQGVASSVDESILATDLASSSALLVATVLDVVLAFDDSTLTAITSSDVTEPTVLGSLVTAARDLVTSIDEGMTGGHSSDAYRVLTTNHTESVWARAIAKFRRRTYFS